MQEPHLFTHDAMKTTFALRLVHSDPALAKNAAYAAIQLIDDLEGLLSRYRPGSDVWQINHMQAGQSLFVQDATYDCLKKALEISEASGGLFDITLGRQIEHVKSGNDAPLPGAIGQLSLDPEKPAIHCLEPGREIDLGGIGKGYALDALRAELIDWGITTALLSSGASTHLAYGDRAWPIQRMGAANEASLQLENRALSISGADVQGDHIVDPSQQTLQARTRERIWVLHDSAASADAWSTACFLMNDEEIASLDASLEIFTDSV